MTKGAFLQLIDAAQQGFQLLRVATVIVRVFLRCSAAFVTNLGAMTLGADDPIRYILLGPVSLGPRRPAQNNGAAENDRESNSLRHEDGQARGVIGERRAAGHY